MDRITWWIDQLFGNGGKNRTRSGTYSSYRRPFLARRPLVLEPLEERRMLTVSYTYANHILTVTGDGDNDTITFNHAGGVTTLSSQAGTLFTLSDSAMARIYVAGNGGNDTINLYGITGNLGAAINGASFPNLISVDISGGDGNDTIIGSDLADTIDGGAGADVLDGGKGDDTINGKAGADYIYGGLGNDTLYGEAGADWIYGDASSNYHSQDLYPEENPLDLPRWFYELEEEDPEVSGNFWDIDGSPITFTGNDNLYGGDGDDHLIGDADGLEELYFDTGGTYSNGGNWVSEMFKEYHLAGGDDQIEAGAGNDVVNGEGGNDTLYGGDGDDTIDGEGGADWIYGDAYLERTSRGSDTDDKGLFAEPIETPWNSVERPAEDPVDDTGHHWPLQEGSGPWWKVESAPSDVTGGDDVLNGGDGDDHIFGDYAGLDEAYRFNRQTTDEYYDIDEGDDIYTEHNAVIEVYDELHLHGGNDQIDGGAGSNVITGEGGDDTYQFTDESGTAALHLGGDTVITAGGTSGESELAEDSWTTPGGTLNKTGEGTLDFNAFTHLDDATTLNINEGVVNVNADAGSEANLSVMLDEDTAVNFNSTQHLDALTIGEDAVATVTDQTSVSVLAVNSIDIASDNASYSAPGTGYTASIRTYDGLLDLTDNDLIVKDEPDFWVVQDMIRSGLFTSGASGIASATVASGPHAGHTTLGSVFNGYDDDYDGGSVTPDISIFDTYAGETLTNHSIIVKYTWIGDADLDGYADSNDAGLFTTGYFGTDPNDARNPWLFGDFNYDGLITTADGDLYTASFYAGSSTTQL